MLCVTRAELETAGTPEGGVALSVAVPDPGLFAMGTMKVAAVPLLNAAKFRVVGLADEAVNDCVAGVGVAVGVGAGLGVVVGSGVGVGVGSDAALVNATKSYVVPATNAKGTPGGEVHVNCEFDCVAGPSTTVQPLANFVGSKYATYDIAEGGIGAPAGNVTEKPGALGKVTATFDVIDQKANGAICDPPMFCGRRRMLCTAGVPLGCVRVKIVLSCAATFPAAAVVPPTKPDPIGPSDRLVCCVVLEKRVPEALATGVGVAVGAAVGVGVVPPGGGSVALPPPPPPPHATSASATKKSKGRPRRWIMQKLSFTNCRSQSEVHVRDAARSG
jgi:hypothetical protein